MPTTRVHHRFSVEEYEEMIARRILTEEDRVELIRGEIIDKMTIGERHGAGVKRLNHYFMLCAVGRVVVSIQDPIVLADSEPETDVALLKPRDDFYIAGKPRATDVLLAIEVSDSSLEYDREVKRALYAEAGIGEYWIVNLIDDCLEVHRDPQPDGTYRSVQTLRRGQQTDVLALPGLTVAVADIL